MFCMKCGTQLHDEADFCPSCGIPTGKSTPISESSGSKPESSIFSSIVASNKHHHTKKFSKLGWIIVLLLLIISLGLFVKMSNYLAFLSKPKPIIVNTINLNSTGSDIMSLIGEYPSDDTFWTNKKIMDLFSSQGIHQSQINILDENMGVVGPFRRSGEFVIISGNAPHQGLSKIASLEIQSHTKIIHYIYLNDDNFNYYGFNTLEELSPEMLEDLDSTLCVYISNCADNKKYNRLFGTIFNNPTILPNTYKKLIENY